MEGHLLMSSKEGLRKSIFEEVLVYRGIDLRAVPTS
jgi:hypothetical protein